MIKYIPLVFYVFLSSAAHADQCKGVETLATVIMEKRQEGVAMSRLMAVDNAESFKNLIIEAYSTPRFSVPSNQREAVKDFANMAYLECVKVVQ